MKVGEIYSSNNYGDVEILEYINSQKVKVQFLNTGAEGCFASSNIKKGLIKDLSSPTVYDTGFIGYGPYRSRRDYSSVKSYDIWHNMISRCYNIRDRSYSRYGGSGVTVCDEWHNFQNFAKWYEDNYPSDGNKYQIDKDLLSCGSKIYSPETCCFLTPEDNTTLATSKSYKMKSPTGYIIRIYNMSEFCRNNNLSYGGMLNVHNGCQMSHKGWRKA